MTGITGRIGGTMAAGAAGLLLLSGCSSDGEAVKAAGAVTSTTTKADPGKAKTLVVDKSAFPAGYTVTDVPDDQLRSAVDQILSTVKTMKVTPADCVQQSLIPDTVDLGSLGLVVATKADGGQSLAEAVVVGGTTIDEQRESTSGKCGKVKVRIDSGPAQGATGTVTSTTLAPPKTKVDPDKMIVVKQQTAMTVRGNQVKTAGIQGMAEVDGYTVSVQASSLTGDGTLDQAAFEQLFVAAVNKVADEA